MPKSKIFISHSTKRTAAEEFLDAVTDALAGDPRFEAWIDRDGISAGDRWRQKIYEAMCAAHAAVLLLTEEALASRFVFIEASVLSWRRCTDASFLLIPALAPGVTMADVDGAHLAELALDTTQFVEGDVDAIVSEVKDRLLEFHRSQGVPKTPLELVESNAVQLLQDAGMTPRMVQTVCGRTDGWKDVAFPNDAETLKRFSRELTDGHLGRVVAVLEALAEQRNEARPALLALLKLVAPFWVEERAATPLAAVALSKRYEDRILAVDSEHKWTAQSFFARAACRSLSDPKAEYIELLPPDDETGSYASQVFDGLRHKRADLRNSSDAQMKLLLNEFDRHNTPVFAIFPQGTLPSKPDGDLLRRDARSATWCLLCPDGDPSALPLPDASHYLGPVNRQEEDSASSSWMYGVWQLGEQT